MSDNINWLTVVITGIGLEIFMFLLYLKNGWTSSHETQWKLAQFLFSILALTTLGLASLRNYTVILTLVVVGMWKFGFSETAVPMYCPIYSKLFTRRQAFLCLALRSIGSLLHHSGAAFHFCMLLSGSIIADRPSVDTTLILCIQHWIVLITQIFTGMHQKRLYEMIQLGLEIWFEWTVFSNMEHAHWIPQ